MAKLAASSLRPATTEAARKSAPLRPAKRQKVAAVPADRPLSHAATARVSSPAAKSLAKEPLPKRSSAAKPPAAPASGSPGRSRGAGAGKASRKEAAAAGDTAADDLATLSSAPRLDPQRSLEKALGAQVRQLRRDRDLSLGDLAAASGLSSGMMSKIENGQISPSLSTINALAGALHVPFTSLFAAFEEKRDCSFVPAGTGNRIERRGTKAGHVYQLLGKVLGGEVSVEPYFITLEADAVPYAGFRHAGVEMIYMLTGEVVYRHGDECYTLKPGDTLLFDSGALHGPERLIAVPMTYLSIIVYPRQQGR